MLSNTIVLVTGFPGVGKTRFSKYLGEELGLPVFNKDFFKELLFDSFGVSNHDESKKQGVLSFSIIENVMKSYSNNDSSAIFEANFNHLVKDCLKDLKNKKIVEINLFTDPIVLKKRIIKRSEKGNRHAGHTFGDSNQTDNYSSSYPSVIGFNNDVLKLDTTDFSKIDYAAVFTFLEKF